MPREEIYLDTTLDLIVRADIPGIKPEEVKLEAETTSLGSPASTSSTPRSSTGTTCGTSLAVACTPAR